MGGEGSIQGMINSIKNNKLLLNRRRITFFDNKRSFSELKGIYTNKQSDKEKEISDAERKAIRDQLIAENKKRITYKILALFFTAVLVLSIGNYLLFSPNYKVIPVDYVDHEKEYSKAIKNGKERLEAKKAFYAIGYFKQALTHKPEDKAAARLLIKSYYLLCEGSMNNCEGIKKEVDSLRKVYPSLN